VHLDGAIFVAATHCVGVATVSTFATKLQQLSISLDVEIEDSVSCLSSLCLKHFK
jgi:hypothetical protein